MIIISKRREMYDETIYLLFFESFAFDCDANGAVDESKLSPGRARHFRECAARGARGEVREMRNRRMIPAVGECECGAHVELRGFTNTCHECDRDYNMSGQSLAPREQWGEETGESLADILSADYGNER